METRAFLCILLAILCAIPLWMGTFGPTKNAIEHTIEQGGHDRREVQLHHCNIICWLLDSIRDLGITTLWLALGWLLTVHYANFNALYYILIAIALYGVFRLLSHITINLSDRFVYARSGRRRLF